MTINADYRNKPIGKFGYTTQTDLADHILWNYADRLQGNGTNLGQEVAATVRAVLQDYDWDEGELFGRKARVQKVVETLMLYRPYGKNSTYTSGTDLCFHILAKHAQVFEIENPQEMRSLIPKIMKEYGWDKNDFLSASRKKRIEDAINKARVFVKFRSAAQYITGANQSSKVLSQEEKTALRVAICLANNVDPTLALYKEQINLYRLPPGEGTKRASECAADDMKSWNCKIQGFNAILEKRQQLLEQQQQLLEKRQQLLERWLAHETQQLLEGCLAHEKQQLLERCLAHEEQTREPHPEEDVSNLEKRLDSYLGPLERLLGRDVHSIVDPRIDLPSVFIQDTLGEMRKITLHYGENSITIEDKHVVDGKRTEETKTFISSTPSNKTEEYPFSKKLTATGPSGTVDIPVGHIAFIQRIDEWAKTITNNPQEQAMLRNAILLCCDQRMLGIPWIHAIQNLVSQHSLVPRMESLNRSVAISKTSSDQIEISITYTCDEVGKVEDPAEIVPKKLTVTAKFVLHKENETWRLDGPYYADHWLDLQDKPEAAAAAPQ